MSKEPETRDKPLVMHIDLEKDSLCYGCKHAMKRPKQAMFKPYHVCKRPVRLNEKMLQSDLIGALWACMRFIDTFHSETTERQKGLALGTLSSTLDRLKQTADEMVQLDQVKYVEPPRGIYCPYREETETFVT